MESTQGIKKEKSLLDNELSKLMEVTLRMEDELEFVVHEANSD